MNQKTDMVTKEAGFNQSETLHCLCVKSSMLVETYRCRLFKISTGLFNAFVKIDESCYISFRHMSNPFANDELTIGQR